MSRLLSLIAMMLVLMMPIATVAHAGEAEELRATGMVGERPDGLLGIVGGADADIKARVKKVNTARLKVYKQRAAEAGQDLETYQAIAGETLIEKVDPGEYYMDASGEWQQR